MRKNHPAGSVKLYETQHDRGGMDKQILSQLVDDIYSAHEDRMNCDSCDAQIDCLAELVSAGYDCQLMVPAVQAHLDCCVTCRETFQALLKILEAQQAGQV